MHHQKTKLVALNKRSSPGPRLTADQARRSLRVPDPQTVLGKRDPALLALMVAAVLRGRSWFLGDAQLRRREKHWILLDLGGNGPSRRIVSLSFWVKRLLDQWLEAAGIINGLLFRLLRKDGTVAIEEKGIE